MGMFDNYIPVPELRCPACLLVWAQLTPPVTDSYEESGDASDRFPLKDS